MQAASSTGRRIEVSGVSNREFLDRYAAAGRIGLSGGSTYIDRAICRAQRHVAEDGAWGVWSHAFVCEGLRCDGQHWVVESDLQIHRKHLQFGVQENRISKYYDEPLYSNLAILDFGLTEAQTADLLTEALELVANHQRYSIRELFGTLLALRRPELRSQANRLARDRSLYCSAFARHLFRKAGLDLVPGIEVKNTTPEDVARTTVPHTTWVLQRASPRSRLAALNNRVRAGVQARFRSLRQA